MKKYVFWSILNGHTNIALTENLEKYAQGDTFWQAMQNLAETLKEWIPARDTEESEINRRIKMYNDTGINKIEIFVDSENDRFGVKSGNTRSFIEAADEREAILKYIDVKAKTSIINTGDLPAI